MPFPGLAVLTVQTAREVKSRRLEQDVVVGSEIRKDSFWVFLRKRLDNCSRRRAGSSSSSVNKDWVSGRSMGELESLRGREGMAMARVPEHAHWLVQTCAYIENVYIHTTVGGVRILNSMWIGCILNGRFAEL